MSARCDSYVVETHVHYPTDLNLLWDAVSKVVTLTACYSELAGVRYWRQWQYNLRKLKKQYRFIQKLKRSNSKQESKQKHRKNEIEQACGCYLSSSRLLIDRVKHTLQNIELQKSKKDEIERFITHAHRQINQIKRRIIDGEKIPHNEKVFSLFQPHTEWISKGKAGVTVEFGVKCGNGRSVWIYFTSSRDGERNR